MPSEKRTERLLDSVCGKRMQSYTDRSQTHSHLPARLTMEDVKYVWFPIARIYCQAASHCLWDCQYKLSNGHGLQRIATRTELTEMVRKGMRVVIG